VAWPPSPQPAPPAPPAPGRGLVVPIPALVAGVSGLLTLLFSFVRIFKSDGPGPDVGWSVWTTDFSPGLFGVGTWIPLLALAAGGIAVARALVPGAEGREVGGFTLLQLQLVCLAMAVLLWLGYAVSILASGGENLGGIGVDFGLGMFLLALGLAGVAAGTVLGLVESRRQAAGPNPATGPWPPPAGPGPGPGGPMAPQADPGQWPQPAAAPDPGAWPQPAAGPGQWHAPDPGPAPAWHQPGPPPGQASWPAPGPSPDPWAQEAAPGPWPSGATEAPAAWDQTVLHGQPGAAATWSAPPEPSAPRASDPGAPQPAPPQPVPEPGPLDPQPAPPLDPQPEPAPAPGGLHDPGTEVIPGPPPAPPADEAAERSPPPPPTA